MDTAVPLRVNSCNSGLKMDTAVADEVVQGYGRSPSALIRAIRG